MSGGELNYNLQFLVCPEFLLEGVPPSKRLVSAGHVRFRLMLIYLSFTLFYFKCSRSGLQCDRFYLSPVQLDEGSISDIGSNNELGDLQFDRIVRFS